MRLPTGLNFQPSASGRVKSEPRQPLDSMGEKSAADFLAALKSNPAELIAAYPRVALAVGVGIGVLLGCWIKRR